MIDTKLYCYGPGKAEVVVTVDEVLVFAADFLDCLATFLSFFFPFPPNGTLPGGRPRGFLNWLFGGLMGGMTGMSDILILMCGRTTKY